MLVTSILCSDVDVVKFCLRMEKSYAYCYVT